MVWYRAVAETPDHHICVGVAGAQYHAWEVWLVDCVREVLHSREAISVIAKKLTSESVPVNKPD